VLQEETQVEEKFYTHGMWRVKPDREKEFIAAWKAMGDVFLGLPNVETHGTLIQSLSDPTLFYSFGPWSSLEDIQAMRSDPKAQEALARVRELCDEASPGTYRVVGKVEG
jgi:heme-degrading monooxygenase HmoA